MNGNEAITRLCALVSEVGSQVFDNAVEHDCFCRGNCVTRNNRFIHPLVLDFIENVVREKIREANERKGGSNEKDD